MKLLDAAGLDAVELQAWATAFAIDYLQRTRVAPPPAVCRVAEMWSAWYEEQAAAASACAEHVANMARKHYPARRPAAPPAGELSPELQEEA